MKYNALFCILMLAEVCCGVRGLYAQNTSATPPSLKSPEWSVRTDRGMGGWRCPDYPVAPGPVTFTGDVERDFTTALATPIIPDNNSRPGDVGQPAWMTTLGRRNGWDVKDVRLAWDKRNDVLYVGVNLFGVAGDADGNGVVGTPKDIVAYWNGSQFVDYDSCKGTSTCEARVVGTEYPGMGGSAGISVGIGLNQAPNYSSRNYREPLVVMAGIPNDKTQAGTGLNGFKVAKAMSGYIIGSNFGESLSSNTGILHPTGPDFEFTITNFSKLPGLTISKGIGITFVSGSAIDGSIGEDSMPYYVIACLQGRMGR